MSEFLDFLLLGMVVKRQETDRSYGKCGKQCFHVQLFKADNVPRLAALYRSMKSGTGAGLFPPSAVFADTDLQFEHAFPADRGIPAIGGFAQPLPIAGSFEKSPCLLCRFRWRSHHCRLLRQHFKPSKRESHGVSGPRVFNRKKVKKNALMAADSGCWAQLMLFTPAILEEESMLSPIHINPLQIPLIEEIERNETWLMGERLGHAVDPKSPEVRSRVAEIVMECRDHWRQRFEQKAEPADYARP